MTSLRTPLKKSQSKNSMWQVFIFEALGHIWMELDVSSEFLSGVKRGKLTLCIIIFTIRNAIYDSKMEQISGFTLQNSTKVLSNKRLHYLLSIVKLRHVTYC